MKTIRASSLPTFAACELMWFARNFCDELKESGFILNRMRNHVGAAVGTASHAGVEHMQRERFKTGSLPDLNLLHDLAMNSYEESIVHGVIFDSLTKNKDVASYQIKSTIAIYRELVAPNLKPLVVDGEPMIEVRKNAKINENFELSGQVDLVDTDFKIRDNKFGKSDSNYSAQFGSYAIIHLVNGLKPNKTIIEDRIARPAYGNVAEYTPVKYDTQTCINYAGVILKRITSQSESFIETGNMKVFLANPGINLCSRNFCPAYGTPLCEVTKNRKRKES